MTVDFHLFRHCPLPDQEVRFRLLQLLADGPKSRPRLRALLFPTLPDTTRAHWTGPAMRRLEDDQLIVKSLRRDGAAPMYRITESGYQQLALNSPFYGGAA